MLHGPISLGYSALPFVKFCYLTLIYPEYPPRKPPVGKLVKVPANFFRCCFLPQSYLMDAAL